jgi:hypothetical protein
VLLLPLLALAPLLGEVLGIDESLLLGLYAALLLLGAATAFLGVSRARHGTAPDWRGLVWSPRAAVHRPPRHQVTFTSPARAQLWFECRRHLLPFPLAVSALTGLYMTLLMLLEDAPNEPSHLVHLGLNFCLYPLILAPFFGCFLGRTGTSAGNPYWLSSFTATRPVRGTALVAAKLRAAGLATLTAWAILLLAAAVWFVYSGSHEHLSHAWNHLRQAYPSGRLAAITLLVLGGPVFITWRLLVNNLWFGLTGRAWIVRGSMLACGVALPAFCMAWASVADNPDLAQRLWADLPGYAAAAALVKLLAATCVGRALLRRGLIEPRALAKVLVVWLLAVAGLFGLLYAAVAPDDAPVSLLASGAVLSVPMVRLLAAPLALAWNRHR